MAKINYQSLREAAEKATPGNWWIDSHGQAMVSFIDNEVLEVFVTDNKRDAVRHEDTGNLSRWRNDNDATFIATANPATVLALLDEMEAAEKQILKLEKLAESESVGADKAAASCVEWMKRCHDAEKRIAEMETLEVKLPEVEKWRSPEAVRAQNAYRVLVGQELSAAGIRIKGE
ncbi:TPA: ead/Ea22-like family protein [Escherichia coli]|nr:ead/Ea22-like family protein [Escherichia coli]